MKKLSVVIPCYNEQETIEIYLTEMKKIEAELPLVFEYIFVNDGSKDDTLLLLREVADQYDNVNFISFSRNFGKEAALLAGLKAATGDFIAVMDVDLQDPPELLPQMYQKIQEGYDIVGTRRSSRTGEPVIRSFFAKNFMFQGLLLLLSQVSCRRVASRKLLCLMLRLKVFQKRFGML